MTTQTSSHKKKMGHVYANVATYLIPIPNATSIEKVPNKFSHYPKSFSRLFKAAYTQLQQQPWSQKTNPDLYTSDYIAVLCCSRCIKILYRETFLLAGPETRGKFPRAVHFIVTSDDVARAFVAGKLIARVSSPHPCRKVVFLITPPGTNASSSYLREPHQFARCEAFASAFILILRSAASCGNIMPPSAFI